MSIAPDFTKAQMAAAILVAMGKPAASRLLKFFKQEELKALVEAARMLRTIPQSDLERIVGAFEVEFAEGAGLLDSADQMDTILNESFSPDEVSALRGHGVATDKGPLPVWPQIEALEPRRVGAFLAAEHPQTAAVVLSNLKPAAAAAVLLTLEKAVRAEVVKRMMSIAVIPPTALKIVEGQLRARLLSESASKDTSAGQSRVAGLLNEMDKAQLDDLMQDLEASGAADLAALRARLFSFEDIVLLPQKARVALFDGIGTELVTLALRGAPAELVEAVLSSIGARSRRMIESELGQGTDGVAAADIVGARKTIASTAIRMSREGAFELPSTQAAA